MTKDQIDAIGQGRVWTGHQALERGLVDELGGMECAIASAAELAHLDDYTLKHVSTAPDFLSELLEGQWSQFQLRWVKSMLGDSFETFQTLRQMQERTGIQARIPYDMKPL